MSDDMDLGLEELGAPPPQEPRLRLDGLRKSTSPINRDAERVAVDLARDKGWHSRTPAPPPRAAPTVAQEPTGQGRRGVLREEIPDLVAQPRAEKTLQATISGPASTIVRFRRSMAARGFRTQHEYLSWLLDQADATPS